MKTDRQRRRKKRRGLFFFVARRKRGGGGLSVCTAQTTRKEISPPSLPPQVDTKNNVLRPKVGENERALVTAGGPLFFF